MRGYNDNNAMGNKMMAIQRRSYFKPSQKEGHNSNMPVDAGLKQITVAIRKAVNMHRYMKNSLTIHCIVLGTRLLMSIVNFFLKPEQRKRIYHFNK